MIKITRGAVLKSKIHPTAYLPLSPLFVDSLRRLPHGKIGRKYILGVIAYYFEISQYQSMDKKLR